MKQFLLITSIFVLLTGFAVAQPTVQSLSPAANELNVEASDIISIQFSESMDVSTFTSDNIIIFGSQRGYYSGSFDNPVDFAVNFSPDSSFLPGEVVTVVATTGLENGSSVAMASPYSWSFTVEAPEGSGKFPSDVTNNVGDGPNKVVSADFNNDGHVDLVSSNSNTDNISVLINNGDGTFASSVQYTTGGTNTSSLTSADIDDDGYMDLIVTNNLLSNNIKVLTNNGDGTFTSDGDFDASGIADYVTTGDINGDGYMDIIYLISTSDVVGRLINDGSGSFGSNGQFQTGDQPVHVSVGDIDGDNDLDLVTANVNSDNITIFTNNGSGSFIGTSKSVGASPREVIMADLNEDGNLDLAAVNHNDNNVSVYLNQDAESIDFSFTFPDNYNTGSFPLSLVSADVDADGDLDLITANSGGDNVSVLANNGSGSFSAAENWDVGDSPRSITAADLNGDDALDFAVVNINDDNISVLLNAGPPSVVSSANQNGINISASANLSATFSESMDAATMVDANVVVMGSITGVVDGAISYDDPSKTLTFNPTNDFLAGEKVTMSLTGGIESAIGIGLEPGYVNSFTIAASGYGNMAYRDSVTLSNSVFRLTSADIDNDGDEDLIGTTNSIIDVYENDGGTFSFLAQSAMPSGFEIVYPADIDNDGDVDLAVHPFSSPNEIWFLENDGSGSFAVAETLTVSSAPDDAIFQDFDGDGNLDLAYIYGAKIAIINWGGGDFTFSGIASFGGGSSYPTPVSITSGDVDNDGDLDIVLTGDDKVVIGINQGGRSFDDESIYEVGTDAADVELADFDGDGYLDIVVVSEEGASFSVLINDQDGTFASAVEYSTSPYWITRVSPFDYDGDGDIDLAMYVYDDNEETDHMLFAYNSSGTFANQLLFQYPVDEPYWYDGADENYTLIDIDGDGDLDLASLVGNSAIAFAENVEGNSSAPTAAASSISVDNTTDNSATISWTKGDGGRSFVLVKEASAVNADPLDNSGYTPNPEFGSGAELGIGNYAVYAGSGSSTTITGLSPETTYHVEIFELNGIPGQEKFLIAGAPTSSFTTNDPPTIWSKDDSTQTFTKADFADWTQAANQDRISENLWLTRADDQGLFNYADEGEFDSDVSPIGTQWAIGTTDNLESLSFDTFRNTLGGSGELEENIESQDMVVYIESENLYFDINFSSWTNGEDEGGGGGFSYTRAKGPEPAPIIKSFEESAGYAVQFDGGNTQEEFIEIYIEDYEIISEFSVEMWVKPDVVDQDQVFIALDRDDLFIGLNSSNQFYATHTEPNAGGGDGGCCELKVNPSALPGTGVIAPSAEIDGSGGSITASAGEWYHVALTGQSGGLLTLYVNGVEQDTVSVEDVSIDDSYWVVGSDEDRSKNFYGTVDELRIWKSVRTESQIRSFMHRTYSGAVGRLTGYWQFNEGSDGYTYDGLNNYEGEFYDGIEETWVTSDAPLGSGKVEETNDFQTGTATVGNASLTMADGFDNPVDVQVSEVETDPNVFPSGYTAGVGGKYFVINLFGDPGTFSVDLTLTYGPDVITTQQESSPDLLKLYKRSSSSTGEWSSVGGATSANATTGEVTWSGITSFSQFMTVADELALDIQLADDSEVTVYDDSTFTFSTSFFGIDEGFYDSELTISVETTPSNTLFIDVNDNEVYDDGTDVLITDAQSGSYTPSAETLRYISTTQGVETLEIKLVFDEAEDAVSLNFLTVEGSPTLDGNADEAGWYMLANPMDSTLGMMLDNIWTQGAVNSNAPDADATLYTFNQDSSQYVAITTDLDTTKLSAGQGLLAYIFAFDDANEGVPSGGGWPKTLTNYGNPFGAEIDVTIKNVDHDGVDGTTGSEGFALLGNPYGWSLSADSVIAKLKREDPLANSYVYKWDPVNKVYKLLPTGAIAPYESFFVRGVTSDQTSTLSFGYEDADTESQVKQEKPENMEFTFTHTESGVQSTSYLRFDEKGDLGIDPYDGYYLGTYASQYANLYSMIGDQLLTINNLPLEVTKKTSYPLYLHSSITGAFDLEWNTDQLPEGIEVTLKNVNSGEVIDIRETSKVELIQQQMSKAPALANSMKNGESTEKASSQDVDPIFILTIHPNAVETGIREDLGIPTQVELHQNYPNPFNPTSVIRYGVPEISNVRLEVFDVLGRRVMTLINNETKQPGRYNIQFDAGRLASGMYIYRLAVGDKVLTKQMTLIK